MTTVKSIKAPITFDQAVTEYYKLKNKYDRPYLELVKKLVKNKEMSIDDKRKRLAALDRPCISCNSKSGTIFEQKNQMLFAKCGGGPSSTCKLNIRLQRGIYDSIINIMNDVTSAINENKVKTIESKYNLLFGFASEPETIRVFDKLKVELVNEVRKYQEIYAKYMSIVDNESKQRLIKEQNLGLIVLIQDFKNLIAEFEKTQDNQFLKDATKLYTDSIQKITLAIRELKYVYNDVEKKEQGDAIIYQLIQEPYTQEQLQMLKPGTENKILSFILK